MMASEALVIRFITICRICAASASISGMLSARFSLSTADLEIEICSRLTMPSTRRERSRAATTNLPLPE